MGLVATVVMASRVGAARGPAGEDGRLDSRQDGRRYYTAKHLSGLIFGGRLRRAAAWDTNGEGLVASYA
jgi:hypothetical protein